MLLAAVRADQLEAARVLIAAGADVNAKDRSDDSPFLHAGAAGRNAILKLLLASNRVDFASTNRYGGTALIPAAHHGHVETVRLLLGTAIDKAARRILRSCGFWSRPAPTSTFPTVAA